ncbi:MAG: glycosyltransferase, partial [Oscillospiraceae bacterium]|nr:glycosyltransferase [Candidatus Equicaccousia limihippi]
YEDIRKKALSLHNVKGFDLLPTERISEVYSLADVGLITCKKGTGNAAMPSKTYSMMACDIPIIASFDVESDLNDILINSGAGKCIEPGNAQLLADEISEMYRHIKSADYSKPDIRDYAVKNFSKNICVNKYVEIIEQAYKTAKKEID